MIAATARKLGNGGRLGNPPRAFRPISGRAPRRIGSRRPAGQEPLVVGTTRTSNRPGEFGPEIGLATGLPANGRGHCLVKYAASGMPLHHGWNAATWVGDATGANRRNFYPGERPDDPNQGTLYRDMLTRFRAAMAAADERSGRPEALRRARMVSTDGFGLLPDTVHYDAAGQVALGRAFATALQAIDGQPERR